MEIERTCPVCGVTYKADPVRLKHGRQTTCSRACSYAFRASKLAHKVRLQCATCGQEFHRTRSQVKSKHGSHFCSPACQYKGRTLGLTKRVVKNPYQITEEGRAGWRRGAKKTRKTRIQRDNYRHTEETVAKLRHATTRAIAEGRVPARSKIEDEVGRFLKGGGVAAICQHPVRDTRGRFACVFDFFVPKHNTVVEVNGTFWHADPRFYPEGPVYASQRRTAVAWARKLAIIARLGYELVIVWENDIKERGDKYLADVLGCVC